ncbi:MAG: DsrE family protein [Thiotrichales bacterium]|nr:DsrE family protein [Thiotrichales bacterium]
MKQLMLLSAGLLLSLNTQAEGMPAFDPGLPPPIVAPGYYASAQKLAVQINIAPNDGDPIERFYLKLINNVNNYYQTVKTNNGTAPQVHVIIHGDGINMLLAAQDGSAPKLAAALDALRAKEGVKLVVCYNTLLGKQITVSQLYKVGADNIVLAGVAELARLQGLGFAYLKL